MKRNYIIGTIFICLFIFDAYLVFNGKTASFDTAVYNSIRSINNGFFDGFFKLVTKAGNAKYVLLLLAFLNLKLSRKDVMMCNLLALTSVGTNTIIKDIFKRSRPDAIKLISQGGYSFPSGHSMIAATLYLYLLYLVIKDITNKKLKIFLIVLLVILIPSIIISRVYVGVHYGSDVLGGLLLGLGELFLLIPYSYKVSGGD